MPIRNTNGLWIRPDYAKYHLENIFMPNTLTDDSNKLAIQIFLDVPGQMDRPIKPIWLKEVVQEINKKELISAWPIL